MVLAIFSIGPAEAVSAGAVRGASFFGDNFSFGFQADVLGGELVLAGETAVLALGLELCDEKGW